MDPDPDPHSQYGSGSRTAQSMQLMRIRIHNTALNIFLGHLSSVFCLLFDKTGNYVFTGADDLLVKVSKN
jgi:hypothetical protein